MPALIEHMDPLLVSNLTENGVPSITAEEAKHQGIPMMSVVLANMMPAKVMQATEIQWGMQYCTEPDVAVSLQLAKFDNDCREGISERTGEPRSRTENLRRYTPLSDIDTDNPEARIGLVILTGDNEEIEPFSEGLSSRQRVPKSIGDIDYGEQLDDLVNWSKKHSAITVPACLGGHLVLSFEHDIQKRTLRDKVFGVYDHIVTDSNDPLMRGTGHKIVSPHSRWGDVSLKQIEERNAKLKEAQRLKVLAASKEIGWLMVKETLPNGHVRIYLQGHPEYDRDDLKGEYERDAHRGQAVPENYFPNDNPAERPIYKWAHGARVLHHNVLRLASELVAP